MSVSSIETQQQNRPWYREFWVWFVIALPLSVVIAGISTAVIAISGADSLVVDDFQKVGLVARRENARERQATALNVNAVIALDRDHGQITVRLGGEAAPSQLRLNLHHPTQPAMDRSALLLRDETGLYYGNIGSDLQGHWHLRLDDAQNKWRLGGMLASDQQLLELNGQRK